MAATVKKTRPPPEPLYPYTLVADPSSCICEDAIFKGSITVGPNTVIHPFASILAHGGPITLGSYCLVEEGSVIENRSSEPMVIGNDNSFEVQCWVQSQSIGNGNTFGVRSTVQAGVNVSDLCVVGEATTVCAPQPDATTSETLPPHTVVFGSSASRQLWTGHGQDQEWASRRLEIENLKDVLPKSNQMMKPTATASPP